MSFQLTRRMGLTVLAVAAAGWLAGCKENADHDHDHGGGGHAHEPKNGGMLVEVGTHQFNLEVLPDPAAGKMTVWILDAHAEDYVRIPAPSLEVKATVGGAAKMVTLAAVANAASGETVGNTSQFEGSADWLKGIGSFSGVVGSVTLGGKNFGDVAFEYVPAGK